MDPNATLAKLRVLESRGPFARNCQAPRTCRLLLNADAASHGAAFALGSRRRFAWSSRTTQPQFNFRGAGPAWARGKPCLEIGSVVSDAP